MVKALDVANFFIYLLQYDEDLSTNMKLNKLTYYAQGHSLVRLQRPLFRENIEAWTHGPVIKSVYHAFKEHGNKGISLGKGPFDPAVFDAQEQELLIDVAREYGQYTGTKLRYMTHAKGSPWDQVYKAGMHNIIIPQGLMEIYFRKHESCEPFEIDFGKEDFIGYRDAEGYLVLPKEWNDGKNQ